MAKKTKPYASISLDLDDQWTYMKTHGDPGWESYPSYLSYAVPRILDFLDRKRTIITFFIVAQDAAFEQNHSVLGEISKRGHEIGNHTFHHDPWLHRYTEAELEAEIVQAEQYIELATGIRPRGFRGPGFSFSESLLKVLAKRGYQYDASTFPNILNPLARAYFLWTSDLSPEERKQRKGLFGSWKDGLRPIRPYRWKSGGHELLEIPVTTMPLFRVPIHASYVLYLSGFHPELGLTYFRIALALCRLTRTEPSILLHPLDFIGCDDTQALSFFPAMRMESSLKLRVMDRMFDLLGKSFEKIPMGAYAENIGLPKRAYKLEAS